MNTLVETSVKRIMVVVDASPNSLASLEMAVDLAARTRAQLETLFVEDVNLWRLAELPFATELNRSSGEARALNESGLACALQTQAHSLRRKLQTFSEQKHVQTTLRIVRGNYVTEALHAEADVLFLYTSKRVSMKSYGRGRGDDWDVMPRRFPHVAPVYVYYPGGRENEHSLLLASDLGELLRTRVVVLLPAGSKQSLTRLKERSSGLLGVKRQIDYETVEIDFTSSVEKIIERGCALLVMSRQEAKAHLGEIRVLQAIHCPLVLVA